MQAILSGLQFQFISQVLYFEIEAALYSRGHSSQLLDRSRVDLEEIRTSPGRPTMKFT